MVEIWKIGFQMNYIGTSRITNISFLRGTLFYIYDLLIDINGMQRKNKCNAETFKIYIISIRTYFRC